MGCGVETSQQLDVAGKGRAARISLSCRTTDLQIIGGCSPYFRPAAALLWPHLAWDQLHPGSGNNWKHPHLKVWPKHVPLQKAFPGPHLMTESRVTWCYSQEVLRPCRWIWFMSSGGWCFCMTLPSSVVVSQWTSMLQVVAWHLKRHGLAFATIDGSVNPKQRMDLVEAFNSSRGPQVRVGRSRAVTERTSFLVSTARTTV